MSKENRKKMYDTLVQNGKEGKKPDLSQDDGSLIKEFGAVEVPKEEKKKGKK